MKRILRNVFLYMCACVCIYIYISLKDDNLLVWHNKFDKTSYFLIWNLYFYIYTHRWILLTPKEKIIIFFFFFTRSMEQLKLLLTNQIMKKIHYIGLCLRIFKISILKVAAPSMAMGGYGGKAHARSTINLYVHGWYNAFIWFLPT